MNLLLQPPPRPRTATAIAAPEHQTAQRRPWRRHWAATEPPVHWALELLPQARDDGAAAALHGGLEIRLSIEDTINVRGLSALQRRQLFLVLACKVRPMGSVVRIAEIFFWDLSPEQRRTRLLQVLGRATADAALNAQACVRDNLAVPLLLQNMAHHKALELVDTEMQLLGLSSRADWLPRHLSLSEYRRTVLGRALIHSPRLVLYEQPQDELPAVEIGIVRQRLWLATHEQGCGVLMSTEQPELASLAATTIWPRDPAVLQDAAAS